MEDTERLTENGLLREPCSPRSPFNAYPGPALLVAGNGVVLSANDLAEPIIPLLQNGATAPLRDAIAAALDGKAAQVTPLLLNDGREKDRAGPALDLVALPWADGATVLLLGRDITLDRSLRNALIESRQRYKDLVEASSDFAWEIDAERHFAFVSPSGALGYAASDLVGRHVRDFLLENGDTESTPFTTDVPVDRVEVWFRDAAGRAACLSATGLPLLGPNGMWRGARGICRDITETRDCETALFRARHRQHLLTRLLRMVRDELEPARMLHAIAEALIPALPVRGITIYRRAAAGSFARVAQTGSCAPAALLEPLLASFDTERDSLEARDEAGRLLARATRHLNTVNGALCLWRAGSDPALGEEETALLDEVSAQIGVANQRLTQDK